MKTVLVTGANKGVGLAVVEAILREQPRCAVILGSRDIGRGESARASLVAIDPSWSDRSDVLELDVSSDRSVAEAVTKLSARAGSSVSAIDGLVNNAGAITGSVADILEVNVYGIRRACMAFARLMSTDGRIVNVTSASGPNFVSRADARQRAFFTDPETSWEQLEQFMDACRELDDFSPLGIASDSKYGLSKACANVLTGVLAKEYPHLIVNACTPGYIDTDLGRETLQGRTPEEAGMKPPAAGARVIMKLLFEPPRGRGHYYGSDGLRSPMDRYRAPGSPEYTGS